MSLRIPFESYPIVPRNDDTDGSLGRQRTAKVLESLAPQTHVFWTRFFPVNAWKPKIHDQSRIEAGVPILPIHSNRCLELGRKRERHH